jgi:hypothetical protein
MLVRSRQNRRPADHQHNLLAALDLAACAAQAIHNARRFREARLAVRLKEERLINAGYALVELVTRVREHADGIREQTSADVGRGLAHIELAVREIEHLVTELTPSVSLE